MMWILKYITWKINTSGKIIHLSILIYTSIFCGNNFAQTLQLKTYKAHTILSDKPFQISKNPDLWEVYHSPFSTPSKFHESGFKGNYAFEVSYSPMINPRLKVSLLLHRFQYRESYCLDNSLLNYVTYKVDLSQYSWRLHYQILPRSDEKKHVFQPSFLIGYNANILLENTKKSFQINTTGNQTIPDYNYDGIFLRNRFIQNHSFCIGYSLEQLIKLTDKIKLIFTYSADYSITDGLKLDFYRQDNNNLTIRSVNLNTTNRYFGIGIQNLLR